MIDNANHVNRQNIKNMKRKSSKPKFDLQGKIAARLEKGDKIALYPTGSEWGYTHYYRFVSDKTTVPDKTFFSMREKGLITDEHIVKGVMSEIIDPKNAPRYYNI